MLDNSEKSRLGLIHVYTGEGKGKTTASLGLAIRAIGHGLRVYMVQFMKIGYTGEILNTMQNALSLEIAPFNVECINQKQHEIDIKLGRFKGYCRHCFDANPLDENKAREAFEAAKKAAQSGRYDLVILDEINVVLDKKILPIEMVMELIETKDPNTELILTGRNAPKELIEKANYVTEMKKLKHPYDKKIYARKGIEF